MKQRSKHNPAIRSNPHKNHSKPLKLKLYGSKQQPHQRLTISSSILQEHSLMLPIEPFQTNTFHTFPTTAPSLFRKKMNTFNKQFRILSSLFIPTKTHFSSFDSFNSFNSSNNHESDAIPFHSDGTFSQSTHDYQIFNPQNVLLRNNHPKNYFQSDLSPDPMKQNRKPPRRTPNPHSRSPNTNNEHTINSEFSPSFIPRLIIDFDRIPTPETIQSAIDRFFPPHSNTSHRQYIPNNSLKNNAQQLFIIFSNFSESIHALSTTEKNQDVKARIFLGGRISSAIENISHNYHVKGLLLLVDLYSPWLNVIHWTRILNWLVIKGQIQLAIQIFEQFILQSKNNQPHSSLSLDSIPHYAKPNSTDQINPSSHPTLHVDQKLINEVFKAYSGKRSPHQLFQFLNVLESQQLLPDPDSAKSLLHTLSPILSDFYAESTLSRAALNDINPTHQLSLTHPYIAYSFVMAYYQHFSRTQLLRSLSLSNDSSSTHHFPTKQTELFPQNDQIVPLASQSHLLHNKTPSQSSIFQLPNSEHPQHNTKTRPNPPFIHAKGQLLSLAPLYSEMGFFTPLHGLITESMHNQGAVDLKAIDAAIALGIRLDRPDLIFGFTQYRFQYISRHLSQFHHDQNKLLAEYYTNKPSSANPPLALSWFQLAIPSTSLTNPQDSSQLQPNYKQNSSTPSQSKTPYQSLHHSKDHFAHTIDYHNFELSQPAIQLPSPSLTPPSLPTELLTNPPIKETKAKQMSVPKYPSYKRFVFVHTDLGIGVETPTQSQPYYANLRATSPLHSSSQLAPILPTSLRYLSNAAKTQPLLQNSHASVFTTLSPQTHFFYTPDSLHILRHLQPDPLHIISLRPTHFVHNRDSISHNSALHQREVIDTELKLRQKIDLPIISIPKTLQDSTYHPYKIDILPILPNISRNNPFITNPALFSTIAQQLHQFFSSEHFSTPILSNPAATMGVYKTFSSSRSFESLSKLTQAFLAQHQHQLPSHHSPIPAFTINAITKSPLFQHLTVSTCGKIINPSLRLLNSSLHPTETPTIFSSVEFTTPTHFFNSQFSNTSKYKLPYYLAPFILQYEFATSHNNDQAEIQSYFHLVSSFSNEPTDIIDNDSYISVPSLQNQLKMQYPHISRQIISSFEQVKSPQRIRPGLAACRRIFLALLSRLMNSQSKLQTSIVSDYNRALEESQASHEKTNSRHKFKKRHHSHNSKHSTQNDTISQQFPLSTQYATNSVPSIETLQPTDNFIPLTHATHSTFQDQLDQWKSQYHQQISSLLSFLQSYSAIQHPEIIEEYFGSILPLLVSLSDRINLTPSDLESIFRIGVDLMIKTHRSHDLDKVFSSLQKQQHQQVRTLSRLELSTDAYLNSLGLPSLLQSSSEGQSTATSAVHSQLLKLLALLTEQTKGTSQELILQLSLASYIVNQFAQYGDINSTLVWGTLVSHMKQNINRTITTESQQSSNVFQPSISSSNCIVSTLLRRLQRSNNSNEILLPLDQQHIMESFDSFSPSFPSTTISDPLTFPRPFFPTNIFSPTFIINSFAQTPIPLTTSLLSHHWPAGISPVSTLGEIFQMIPDFSLIPTIAVSSKSKRSFQQSLRLFEHALLVSEAHPTLPRLMASVVYLDSIYSIFRSIIANPISSPPALPTPNSPPSLPHSTTPVVSNPTLQTIHSGYYLFWHLLACVEQKQLQHLNGIDTAASSQNSLHYLHSNHTSATLIASLDQLLSQPQHFNLNDTVSNFFILGTKLSKLSIPPPKPQSGNTDVSDDIHNESVESVSNDQQTQTALLTYTDKLFIDILSIWARVPSYQNTLSYSSPFISTSDSINDSHASLDDTQLNLTQQTGSLSFVTPTESIIASLHVYLHSRLINQPNLIPSSLSLSSFQHINMAVEQHLSNHSPTPLQQLESFKLYRDHKHQTIMDGLTTLLDKPNNIDYQGDFVITHSPLEHQIDLAMEAVQVLAKEPHVLNERELTQLTQGQYPYPTRLTLDTTSEIVISPQSHSTSKPSTIESDIAAVIGCESTSSPEVSEWVPSRSDLLQGKKINTIGLKSQSTSLQLDSHLTVHHAVQTVLLISDLLSQESNIVPPAISTQLQDFLQTISQPQTEKETYKSHFESLNLQQPPTSQSRPYLPIPHFNQTSTSDESIHAQSFQDESIHAQSFQDFHNSLVEGCHTALLSTPLPTPQQPLSPHLFLLQSNRTLSKEEHVQFTNLLANLSH